jgi:O-antigen ligase
MAVHSKHPASAPPAAPAREKTGHLMLRAWCVFVLFMALSGTAWITAIGELPTAIGTSGGALLSIGLWFAVRPPVQWRRLPWFTVAYVVWAALSIIWSQWREATAITLLLLVITTLQGLFIGSVLTWRELIRAIASALKWVMALSLAFELWVSVFIGGPILPGFIVPSEPAEDPIVYWSRDNLFDGGRIQGIMGNANLLGPVALLAIIVFSIRFAAGAPRRTLLGVWIGLSAYLFYRASSATAYVAALAVAIALVTVLLMRRARRPGERTRYYLAYVVIGLGGALTRWLLRDQILTALGRSADLTGREAIWEAVLERAVQHPLIGWGFSTPWIAGDPAFDGWIIDHGQTVMQAHNMWLDVYLQLGLIGVFLMGMAYLAFLWRSWFFAVDRPRWDLRDDRPYSPLTLLPTLVGAVLLVQGFAESSPLLLWGWLFLVMLAFKIKQSPHVGEGEAEMRIAIERGELTARLS